MLGYISMPGGWEWLVIGTCFLVPAVIAVAVIVFVVVKSSQKPTAGPAVICGKCGQPNPTTSRFCSQCGQSLQNKAE